MPKPLPLPNSYNDRKKPRDEDVIDLRSPSSLVDFDEKQTVSQ